jgi:hypothetical protein
MENRIKLVKEALDRTLLLVQLFEKSEDKPTLSEVALAGILSNQIILLTAYLEEITIQ